MKKLKTFSLIAGLIGVLISLVSLTLSQRKIGEASEESRIKQWQAVAVFSIIDRSGSDGASFDNMKALYLDAVQQFSEFDLPKKAISDEALWRVLIELISAHVVVPIGNSKYRVAYEPIHFQDPNIKLGQIMMDASRRVAFYIQNEPNHYTLDGLVGKILPEFPGLNASDLRMLISDGVQRKLIIVGEDKKLSPSH